MRRVLFAAAIAVATLGVGQGLPVRAAPVDTPDRAEVQRYGEWVSRAITASASTAEVFAELTPELRRSTQGVRDAATAKVAAAELSALITAARPRLVAAQEAVRALVPIAEPLDSRFPFATRQLRADLVKYGDRMLAVIDDTLGLANAMAAGDRAAAARHAKTLEQSSTALVQGQLTLVRARRAIVPAEESTAQALSLLETLYQTMALVMQQRFAPGRWPGDAFSALATRADELSAQGDRAAAAEIRQAGAIAVSTEADRRYKAALTASLEAERESFVIGRELAALLRVLATSDVRGAMQQLGTLTAIESRFLTVTQRQAQLLAGAN